MLFKILTDTRWSASIFIIFLLVIYALLPLFVYYQNQDQYFLEVAQLCFVACICIAIGFQCPLFDGRFRQNSLRVIIGAKPFHFVVWAGFIVFLVVTFTTASSIPIISVFQGADADELSQQRGDFLKGRVGIQIALLYLSTLFVSALLPYSLTKLFISKSRFRYWLMSFFFLFSISFLQKILFINVVLPLFYLAARKAKTGATRILLIVIVSTILLYIVTVLASGGKSEFDVEQSSFTVEEFFSSKYPPSTVADLLIWRSFSVPVFTASDTLLVFNEQFGGQSLLGATSSFFSAIFSLEHVPMEKLVFEHQFGWNDIANSNAIFFTDAYVNFGWGGVIFYSLFVGQSLRWFYKSRDEAFKSLWTIYCFSLFSGSLVGTLLSNGYILMFILALFIKIEDRFSLRVVKKFGV